MSCYGYYPQDKKWQTETFINDKTLTKTLMKYIYYFEGILLGVALLLAIPSHVTPRAFASEQIPIIDSYSPTSITANSFAGSYITITGQLWLDQSYGMNVQLFDPTNLDVINLNTVSYVPLGGRMVVAVPISTPAPSTARVYDLWVSTINGTRAIVNNALLVTISENNTGGGAITPPANPVITPAPATSPMLTPDQANIVSDNSYSPSITSYTASVSPFNGYITIAGSNWPNVSYGLNIQAVNQQTGNVFNLDTLSYCPLDGVMVVQIPNLMSNAPAGVYDLIITTINGSRTIVHNALQY
jgi:hypothetical protein